MFGFIGDLIRAAFHRDDEEEKRRNPGVQSAPGKFNMFDASKLTQLAPGNKNPAQVQQPTQAAPDKPQLPQSTVAYTPTNSRSFSTQQKSVIDDRLNKGWSWEDISRDSGVDLDSVKAYSQATRPNYGLSEDHVKAKDELETAIRDTRGDWTQQKELLKHNAPIEELGKARDSVVKVQERQRFVDEALGDNIGSIPLSHYGDKTTRQFLEEFNAADAGKQRELLKQLQENEANYRLDFGNEHAAKLRDQSLLLLNVLEDRAQRKTDLGTGAADVGDVAAGVVTGPLQSGENVVRSGQALLGKTPFDDIEADYKSGAISEDEYIRRMNQTQNELSEFTGGMTDRGVLDRIMRSAGTAVDVTSAVVPALSVAKGLKAGSVATAAQRSLPAIAAREAGINAGLAAAGSLRSGTDLTMDQMLSETVTGGAIGAGATVGGAALGVGYQQAKKGLNSLSRTLRNNALMTAADSGELRTLPLDELTSLEGAPDRSRVEEYKARILGGGRVEPLIAMPDERGNINIEDGKHRLQAMKEVGLPKADVVLVTPQSLRAVLEGGYVQVPGRTPEGEPQVASPKGTDVTTELDTQLAKEVQPLTAGRPAITDPLSDIPGLSKETADQLRAAAPANANTAITEKVVNGVPSTLVTQDLADGRQMVTTLQKMPDGTMKTANTEWVRPETQAAPTGASDAAEGYFSPKAEQQVKQEDVTDPRPADGMTPIASVIDDYATNLMLQRPTLAVNKTLARDVAQKELETGRGQGAWQDTFDQMRESGDTPPRRNNKGVIVADAKNGQQLLMKADENGHVRTYVVSGPVTKKFTVGENGEIQDAMGRKKAWEITTRSDEKGGIEVVQIKIGDEVIDGNELGNLQGLSNYGSTVATMDENLKTAAPDEATYQKLSELTYRHAQHQATDLILRKAELIEDMKQLRRELGIGMLRSGKKISAAIQDFGEGEITFEDLVSSFGKETADKIVAADKWFRGNYDALIREANQVLERYGLDPIPYRKNYYTHFQEPGLFEKFGIKVQEALGSMSGVSDEMQAKGVRGSIPNSLAGFSEYKQPKKQFNPFALKREGEKHTADAFTAFEKYLDPVLSNIYLTSSIVRTRALDAAIQEVKQSGYGTDKLLIQLREWANNLSGKSNRMGDRWMADTMLGRPVLNLLGQAQAAVGRNSIVGNISTALVQPVVLTQVIGKHGVGNTLLGLISEMAHTTGKIGKHMPGIKGLKSAKNDPIEQSEFLARRYADVSSPQRNLLERAADKANMMLTVVEQFTARAAWRSSYHEALGKGLKGKEAVTYADRAAESDLAGRSIGEKPEAFRSRALGPLTQFQLEVANANRQFLKEMTWPQRARFMLAAYTFGEIMQAAIGRSVGLNPLGILGDALAELQDDENEGAWEKTKAFGQQILGGIAKNIPGTSLANAVLDDKTRDEWFGSTDIGRFGNTAAISQIIKKPWYLISPFGAGQVEKTLEGKAAADQGFTADSQGRIQTPIDTTDPLNVAKGLALGTGGFAEQREYYDKERKPLSDEQTTYVRDLPRGDRKAAYDQIQGARDKQAETRKEREGRKADLQTSGATPTGEAGGSLKDRAKKLKDDSSLLSKSLDDVIKEKGLPETLKSYEEIVAHMSGNYEDFVEAYDLKPKDIKRGSGKYDGLVNDTSQADVYAIARGLFKGDTKYENVPDDIKTQFYNKHGLKEPEVEYDTYAKFPSESKAKYLTNQLGPMSYEERLKTLTEYRRESYSGEVFANNKAIDDLVDAELISKDDAKALKAITVGRDGKTKKSKKAGGGAKGLKIPDYNITLPERISITGFAKGAPKTEINPSMGKLKVRGIKAPDKFKVTQTPIKGLAIRK